MEPLRSYQWDYVTFICIVLFSISIGIYSRFTGSKKLNRSKIGFSFATGNISTIVVFLSIARTGLGIRMFLGIPAEFFYHGVAMWETLYGVVLGLLLVSFIFMPVYFAMPTTSIYEYLELRFRCGLVRRFASFLYILRSVLMLGVTMITPCVAIRAVMDIPYWISTLSVGIIAMLFTAIGGMREVILNDVLQGVTMFTCVIAIVSRAYMKLPNGLVGAFHVAAEKGRWNVFDFNLDPRIRLNTLTSLTGQVFSTLATFGCQQAFAQKYRSLPNEKIVRRTLLCASPLVAILESTLWVTGVVVFALYADCDPLTAGFIKSIDELVPFYMQREFSEVPAIMGLFIASLFVGSLGIAVALLNAVATVTWEDFLRQFKCVEHLTEEQQVVIIRSIGMLYGMGTVGVAMAVSVLPGLLETSSTVTAITSGPLLGVFLLALMFPPANKKGAMFGMVLSLGFSIMMIVGRMVVSRGITQILPLSMDQCPDELNITQAVSLINTRYEIFSNDTPMPETTWIVYFFSITYMYYSALGCSICILAGLFVSYITAVIVYCLASPEEEKYEDSLIHPMAKKISNMLPGKRRMFISASPLSTSTVGESTITIDYFTHL